MPYMVTATLLGRRPPEVGAIAENSRTKFESCGRALLAICTGQTTESVLDCSKMPRFSSKKTAFNRGRAFDTSNAFGKRYFRSVFFCAREMRTHRAEMNCVCDDAGSSDENNLLLEQFSNIRLSTGNSKTRRSPCSQSQ